MTNTLTKSKAVVADTAKSVSKAEIVFWWITRALLLVCIFRAQTVEKAIFTSLSLIGTFSVDIFHLVFKKESFFGKISAHAQSCICVAAFFGAGIGVGLNVLEAVPEYDIPLQIIAGIIATVLGYFISLALREPSTKNEINFTVFLSFCISGTTVIIREITEFFIDFYTGRNLMHCDMVGNDHWLYRLFGTAMSPDGQRPLLDTDEDFAIAIISSIFAAAVLYIYLRVKNKALYVRSEKKPAFSIGSIPERIKAKILLEKEKLSADTSIFDILFWWSVRVSMLYAFIVMENRAEATLLLANLIGTFAITLVHFVFPKDTAFCKISYKTQTLVTIIVFLGSYGGNFIFIYNIIPRYDLFLHLISGYLCVMGGYYFAKTLINSESKKNNLLLTVFAFAFSCFMMPAWEVSEFIGDFIWGTANQGFHWDPAPDSFFFKVFGYGMGDTELYSLFDTFYDVLLAMITTVITTLCLYIGIERKRISLEKSKGYKNENQKQTVSC